MDTIATDLQAIAMAIATDLHALHLQNSVAKCLGKVVHLPGEFL